MVRNDSEQILTDTRSWNLTVIPSTLPTADSVTPSAGSGLSQTFSYVFSDPQGYQDITSAQIVVSEAPLSGSNSCFLRYLPAANGLYLRNDAGSAWLGPQSVEPPVSCRTPNAVSIWEPRPRWAAEPT